VLTSLTLLKPCQLKRAEEASGEAEESCSLLFVFLPYSITFARQSRKQPSLLSYDFSDAPLLLLPTTLDPRLIKLCSDEKRKSCSPSAPCSRRCSTKRGRKSE
jgi:hypothetical protein